MLRFFLSNANKYVATLVVPGQHAVHECTPIQIDRRLAHCNDNAALNGRLKRIIADEAC